MPPYPNDDDFEEDLEEEEFVEEDSEDDDDEGEFLPGMEEEDDENEGNSPLQVHGKLLLKDDRLVFVSVDDDDNRSVHLVSTEAFATSTLASLQQPADEAASEESRTMELEMVGHFQLQVDADDNKRKRPSQSFQVTLTKDAVVEATAFKSTGDSNDDDQTKPASGKTAAASSSGCRFQMFGRQATANDGDQRLEFRGRFSWPLDNSPTEAWAVDLTCDVRYTTMNAAVTSASSPAAAVAVGSARRDPYANDGDYDDDEDEEADEEVDYDELIALHEEAGLPVEQLRKRIVDQESSGAPDAKRAATSNGSSQKKSTADDDEDEYGF
jgi:hypothetical protein